MLIQFFGAASVFVGFILFVFALSQAIFKNFDKLTKLYPKTNIGAIPLSWISISPSFGSIYQGSQGAVYFSATKDGVYLKVFWMFRFGRDPFFVPWKDLSLKQFKAFKFFLLTEFSFRKSTDISMRIYERDWKRLLKKFGTIWPAQNLPAKLSS